MATRAPTSRSLVAQRDARRAPRPSLHHAASAPSMGGHGAPVVSALELGAFAEKLRRSWDLPAEEAERLRQRKLKGCPGPLPDPAKFCMYQDLGISDKGLDKTVQRFVSFWPDGAAKSHGPCFRFRTGANMHKLTEHWPACPMKHGVEALPAPQDQLLRQVGDLMDAMKERCSSDRKPWPLDAHGFPDWSGVTDGLRGPPGKGFYPVHPTDVEQASDIATRDLASKLMFLLEQPESQLGSVGAALRIVAQSEEGEDLGITGRSVMAKFLRRRAEPTPDQRTGGVNATDVPKSTLWTGEDESELAWVEALAEQATAALGELYQRKLRAIREGGVEPAPSVERRGAHLAAGTMVDERERRRQELQRRRHLSQRPKSAAAAFSMMGPDQPSTWQKEYGATPPSVNKALLEVRRQRGVSAWNSVRHIAGVGGPPASIYSKSRRARSPSSAQSHKKFSSSPLPGSENPCSASPRSAKSDQSRRSAVSAKTSPNASPPRGSRSDHEQFRGSTVEEEEQLDATLEDMFDIDASRTFFMNRIPRVLTPGASYFDRSEGTVIPTPLETFHNSRSLQVGQDEHDASSSVFQQRRPTTAPGGVTSTLHRRPVTGSNSRKKGSGSGFLATASNQARASGRGRGAHQDVKGGAGSGASMQENQSFSNSTLQLGTEDIRVSSSFWELYDASGAAEKAPDGPEPAGTQSSRHGFLAGESSWSNRASVIGVQPHNNAARQKSYGRGKRCKGRHEVRNPSMENAMKRGAAEAHEQNG